MLELVHLSELTLPEDIKLDESMNERKAALNKFYRETHTRMVKEKLKGPNSNLSSNYERLLKLSEMIDINHRLPSIRELTHLIDPTLPDEPLPRDKFEPNPNLL
jgi:hypothetical protein